jgi:hypothetical protein
MADELFRLESGESLLGKWTLNYIPSTGERYLGKLSVTNKRVIFIAQFDVGAIAKAAAGLTAAAALAGTLGLNNAWVKCEESLVSFAIPKPNIKQVEPKKSFFSKSVKLTLDNGSVHVFHYGILSVNKIVAAIQAA